MRHALDLFRFDGRVSRRQYLGAGTALAAIKYGLDSLVAFQFNEPWNPLMYVSPRVNPLLRGDTNYEYWLALALVALPFLWMGVSLTARRLRDLGIDAFWAGLFLLPFLKFPFFVAIAALPSAPEPAPPGDVSGPYRESSAPPLRLTPQRFFAWLIPERFVAAYFLSLAASVAIGLFAFVVTAQLNQVFGAGLFIGAPFAIGFATAYLLGYYEHPRHGIIRYAFLNLILCLLLLLATGWEGLACVVMALPIVLGVVFPGALLGRSVARSRRAKDALAILFGLAFFSFTAWDAGHALPAADRSVVSTINIAAPIETVWHNVIAFPPIDEPPEPIFAIVGMPIEARIEGTDPGALRRCIFTNGEFEEPVKVWDAPRELTFGVRSQPKYLDEYLSITQGQFALTQNSDGTTTIRGTTWYSLKLHPLPYWTAWGEYLLHRIHLRVLGHIKHLSESPPAQPTTACAIPSWIETAHATCNCTQHPPK